MSIKKLRFIEHPITDGFVATFWYVDNWPLHSYQINYIDKNKKYKFRLVVQNCDGITMSETYFTTFTNAKNNAQIKFKKQLTKYLE